jgi:hypothetical protein
MRDTDHLRAPIVFALALGCSVACSVSPGGGVSGTVHDPSGKPIPGVEIRLGSPSRFMGWDLPFAQPDYIVTTTDELGHFGVVWTHGDPKDGPLLEVAPAGYGPAVASLAPGTLSCDIELVPIGAAGSRSQARCRVEHGPEAAAP